MYDWLTDASGDESPQIVTANRRLARTLVEHYGRSRIASGELAWRRPAIYSWNDWLAVLVDASRHVDDLPLRINTQQSRVLWEQCLQQDIDDPLISIASLAGLCRDTWRSLHEWRVPLLQCQKCAAGPDQRIFARAAGRYLDALQERRWIDDAQLPARLTEMVRAGHLDIPNEILLAGFDRVSPEVNELLDAFTSAGANKTIVEPGVRGAATLKQYDNPDAELRAAGAWARAELEQDPSLTVGIVVSNLEQDADRCGRLLREGLTPGWQYGGNPQVLNLSYGRRLPDYAAIHIALLALRWLYQELRCAEISQLLRSPFIGMPATFGRSRLELKLRDWPDRHWSRALLLAALSGQDEHADVSDWLDRLASVSDTLDKGPARRRPSDWAKFFSETLTALNWPGEGALSSADFQLVNRWRELLNEFARVELVRPTMFGPEAVTRLTLMAGDTVFQSEAEGAIVNVLGPLEAAGLQFDRLWVCGLTAGDWPPPTRPQVLLSRELQREYGMPDADPADTALYASRVVERLRRSAPQVDFSYPKMVGDAQQMPAALLADIEETAGAGDPGWHAASLSGSLAVVERADRVPRVASDEAIAGGARTINQQRRDPFSAFAYGRLGVRWLQEFRPGITPIVRGNLVHDALFRLYRDKPSQTDIRAWTDDDATERIDRALRAAFRRHERSADSTLKELLKLERRRTRDLLCAVVAVDRGRQDFKIDSVENGIQTTIGEITIKLRCDRIDRLDSGQFAILDYKTGQTRKFVTGGEPQDMQLVVYACAVSETVAGLGLFNVDSRQVSIDGVGPAFSPIDDWEQVFAQWKQDVRDAALQIAAGDVRVNVRQSGDEARPLSLLSRYAEIRHES